MPSYRDFHRSSIEDRENFWAGQAKLIHWHKQFDRVLDYSRPPFARWFVGGQTNLCHNAVDRHLAGRGNQTALVWISTEVDEEKSFTYKELFAEVNRMGKAVLYKSLVDEALKLAKHPPAKVLLFDRGLDPSLSFVKGRDVDWKALQKDVSGKSVACAWLESNEPSYILYTSGTTGHPKGVQRDVGGYAVALAASMQHIFCGNPGETMFTTSDIGWVVGHSYIIYAPLIAGMTTIMYEGVPLRPDAGIWWKICTATTCGCCTRAPGKRSATAKRAW